MKASGIISLVALVSVGLISTSFEVVYSALNVPPSIEKPLREDRSDLYNLLDNLDPWTLSDATRILQEAQGNEMIGTLSVDEILSVAGVESGCDCTFEELKKFIAYSDSAAGNSGVEKFINYYRDEWKQKCGSKLNTVAKSAADSIKYDRIVLENLMRRIELDQRDYTNGRHVALSAFRADIKAFPACKSALETYKLMYRAMGDEYGNKVLSPEFREMCSKYQVYNRQQGRKERRGPFGF